MNNTANENALYEIAKQVTLEAGMPYTDPRTGKTTQPPKIQAKRKRRHVRRL